MNTKKIIVVGAILAMALTLFFTVSPGLAQYGKTPYFVRGYVYNSTGSPVPEGVTVYITDTTKDVTINTTTNEAGVYDCEIYDAISTSEDGDQFTCFAAYMHEYGLCPFILNIAPPPASQWCNISLHSDTIAPIITELQPLDDSVTNDSTPTISASYYDPAPGSGINVSSAKIFVDNIDRTEYPNTHVTPSGVSYTPTTNLGESPHNVIVSVSDNEGIQNSTSWTFRVDTIAPTVTDKSPKGTGVDTTTTIRVKFSEPMDKTSVENAFSSGGSLGPFKWTGSTEFTRSASLSYSTTYTVKITTDAKDPAGNSLASPYSWSFTTKSEPFVGGRGGGGAAAPRDTDGDGISDIDEMLAGTDWKDPCDPNPECAACLALRPRAPTPTPRVTPTPTPAVTPTLPPAVTPTPTPAAAAVVPPVIPWVWIIIAIVAAAIIVSVVYVLRRKP